MEETCPSPVARRLRTKRTAPGGKLVPMHFWIVSEGWTVDYRLGMWLKGAPHGVMQGTTALASSTYGKGRVYYSTLGHPKDNWDDPRLQKMYTEAIKWAMGLESADITPQPAPAANLACK